MTSITDKSVDIQTSSESHLSTPCWFGEAVLIISHLRKQGVLDAINSQVHFARRRFGQYEVIDFLAVLFGYAMSGERTLEAFYQRLQPLAVPFIALFGRDCLPSCSALSRFLAALTQAPVDALRTLFLDDLLRRPFSPDKQTGGLVNRAGNAWVVIDIDGTRQAARQRSLPQTEDLPPAFRRLDEVCAPGYNGRKRGQVVHTRTVISQAHSYQWLGSFGNRGNGQYRVELRQGLTAITRYLAVHQFSQECTLLRLDGQYGTGAVLADLAGFAFVTRGKEYSVLDHPLVQARLHLPPDQFQQRPESHLMRSLYDCPAVPVGSEGICCRVIVATHPAGKKKSPVGVTRAGIVYELFFTTLPQQGFTASDVVELYLHRGAFETALADEDEEQDPDRWFSHAAWGQECWQVVSQWTWNLRLELGHQLKPQPVRTTEFAPAIASTSVNPTNAVPMQGYGPLAAALPWKAGRFSGQDIAPHGAAPGSRWQFARALQRQHPRLSRLPVASAMPVAWGCHDKTTSHQFAASSASGWLRAATLAGLESQRTPACLSPACALSTNRGGLVPTCFPFAHYLRRDPFARTAGPHSSLMGDAPGSQHAEHGGWSGFHQTVWGSTSFFCLAQPSKLLSTLLLTPGLMSRVGRRSHLQRSQGYGTV